MHNLQRLLDHLKEAAFFSQKDLDSIANTLKSMRETVERGKGTCSPDLVTLLQTRLNTCEKQLAELQHELSFLSPELAPTHETLVSILRSTAAANTRTNVSSIHYPSDVFGRLGRLTS